MTAVVLAFPAAKRRDLVISIARRALSFRHAAGEQHVERSLRLQAEALRRKGVTESDIQREMKSLEAAVRAVMWESVMQPRETR
jgi:Family of unknown function (DUF6074)